MTTAGVRAGQAPRVAVLQLAPSDPPGRLLDWLAEDGLAPEVHELATGDPVPDASAHAGYGGLVVLGGPMSATDRSVPYLATVQALLRDAVSRELPTLAVCLGAQLLALAHGGRVEPNPEGPELGAQLVAKRANAATDPLFRELPITPDVIQWHHDAITALPAGAVQLAGAPLCENQAFRLGRLAWGLQFHIETTPEIVRGWARDDADRLAGYDGAAVERMLARADAAHADVAEVWRPFAAAFAGVVREPGAVRQAHPMRSSTAAPVTDPAAIRAALAAEAQAAQRGGGPGHEPGGPRRLPMPEPRPPHDG